MCAFSVGLLCDVVFNTNSSLATILLRKRELVVLLFSSYCCSVTDYVLYLFLSVPWVGCGISWHRGYKKSCSIQLSKKFIMLIIVKMSITVGILTFTSMINSTSDRLKERNFFICWYFSFYEQLKLCSQFS